MDVVEEIAKRLATLDEPKLDAALEIELRGVKIDRLPSGLARAEGTGPGTRYIGPRYAAYWEEAQKLAVAVHVARGV